MKGFLRRDLYFFGLNAWFYVLFIGAMGLLCVASDFQISFLCFYVTIFSASALMGLFGYDEANRWQAYAAAVPGGRKGQVHERYLLALLLSVVCAVILLAITLASGGAEPWGTALTSLGVLLLYVDVIFPLQYQFGAKSRLLFIIILGVVAGVMALGGLALSDSREQALTGQGLSLLAVGAVLAGIGLAGMVVSHLISVTIMKRKEL